MTIEQGGDLNDLWFHWQGDSRHWHLLYELGSGSGLTREIKDGEQIIIRRRGNHYEVISSD